MLNAHRKANKELKEKVYGLEEMLERRDRELLMSQEKIETIQLEKQVLEKEWARVVKAVKKKIAKISEQGLVNP